MLYVKIYILGGLLDQLLVLMLLVLVLLVLMLFVLILLVLMGQVKMWVMAKEYGASPILFIYDIIRKLFLIETN